LSANVTLRISSDVADGSGLGVILSQTLMVAPTSTVSAPSVCRRGAEKGQTPDLTVGVALIRWAWSPVFKGEGGAVVG
jgi:hypothetical protein